MSGRLRGLFSHITPRLKEFDAGDILLPERHVCTALLFLEDGWACRFVTTRDGKRHSAAAIVPGDCVNLEAIVADEMDCGVQMLTPGKLHSIPLAAVRDAYGHVNEVAQLASSLAMMEKAILAQHTLRLGRMAARERLMHLLCELVYRTGHGGHGRPGDPMEVPLTQEWLADLLGLTTVHVNRTLQQLRSEGLLESRSHRVVVPDVEALRLLCDFDPRYLAAHGPSPGSYQR